MFDDIDAIAREAKRINDQFHRVARKAYQFARSEYADPKYEAFRDSEAGRAWKQQKLAECHYRCPECDRTMSVYTASIDHKHPRRHYPWLAWEISNLWILCKACNKAKADMEWNDYLAKVKAQRGQTSVNHILKYAPPCEVNTEQFLNNG